MRIPRLTVRRLMALVALVGLALAVAIMMRRSSEFRELAMENADAERLSPSYADEARGRKGDPRRVARGEQMAAYHRGKAVYAAEYPG